MNIFVTGATGYVGSGIAQALKLAGHTVIGLVRSETEVVRLQAQGIQPFKGDLTDLERIAANSRVQQLVALRNVRGLWCNRARSASHLAWSN